MKKRFKSKKKKQENDPILPHGMKLSEYLKLTQSRCGNTGYVIPVPPRVKNTSGDIIEYHNGDRHRMVPVDPNSKTQKRKAKRVEHGQGTYGKQGRHKQRQDGRQAGGNRRRAMGHSKRQVLRTCGKPFSKPEGTAHTS